MSAMTEQQKARIVELAERAVSDMKARAWHREDGYHVFADTMTHDFIRPASAEAFRIARGAEQ